MYTPTKDVSGILPIPEEIRFKSAMQPMAPEPLVKKVTGAWHGAKVQNMLLCSSILFEIIVFKAYV